MSVENYTNYNFSFIHGVTGCLATSPVFSKTKKGNLYAKIPVYCKSVDVRYNDFNINYQDVVPETDKISLIACVMVFDFNLLKQVKKLNQGYFVNFKFDKIVFGLGKDSETKDIKANAFLIANDIEIKHIPSKNKENK